MRLSRRLYVLGVLLAVGFFWQRVFRSNLFPLLAASPVAPLQCSPTLGRGVSHYAGLSQRSNGSASSACLALAQPHQALRHCCLVRHQLEGRTGNQLVNYFAGRLYAELHSCASSEVSFGDGLGREGGVSTAAEGLLWPPAGGEGAWPGPPLDATQEPSQLRQLFESGSASSLVLKSQLERADVLYVAASLAWDLQGATLVGRALPALAPAVLKEEATEARCRRWWEEREACWQDAGGRALHPWMPQGLRALAVQALRWGEASAAAAAAAASASQQGASQTGEGSVESERAAEVAQAARAALAAQGAALPPGLRAVAEDPEGTLVVHARLGDMSAMAWQEAAANAGAGQDAEWREAEGGAGWQWVPERFPGYRYPKFPDCQLLRQEREYNEEEGREMLEALEWDAARLGGFVVSPLSFYQGVLAGGAWRTVVVLTEQCSADHPIVRALVQRHGAIVQSGSVVEDLATMALARELVISSSTFSLMAALLGRARAVHVPYAGSFSLLSSHNRQCLTPTGRLDPRVVYHDVYRRAVDAVAEQLQRSSSSSSKWMWRAEGKGPLPVRPAECPASLPGNSSSGSGSGEKGGLPYTHLTWEQLAGFYRHPACAGYYYPPRDAQERSWRAAYIQDKARHPICTDTEWSLYTGAHK